MLDKYETWFRLSWASRLLKSNTWDSGDRKGAIAIGALVVILLWFIWKSCNDKL